jgi:FkbM family methyltransferase
MYLKIDINMIKLKKILSNISDNENFTFVSIGANDGIFVDEVFLSNLLNINWSSLFVEPVKERFDLLVSNYQQHYPNNDFKYENSAIHIEKGEDFLITPKNDDSRGLCSFFREESEYTDKIPVTKITFKDLIEKYKINKINFLKIDCEGMDSEIILQVFDNNIIPDLILFEDINLHINNDKVRGFSDLIERINNMDEVVLIDDIAEVQYEEGNKLIIKKELLKYV